MIAYRSDLPPRPKHMEALPLDERGFPVPWFVAWIDGKPDFRVIRKHGIATAHNNKLCWLCGQKLGQRLAFVVGPMCGINRVSSEPPSHRDCAEYACKACPFLTRPMAVRNERGLNDIRSSGIMIERNPGVALLWLTKDYKPFRVGSAGGGNPGVLFELGNPTELHFYAKGRKATRDEIDESVRTGLPHLEELAELDGPNGHRELRKARDVFDRLIARYA